MSSPNSPITSDIDWSMAVSPLRVVGRRGPVPRAADRLQAVGQIGQVLLVVVETGAEFGVELTHEFFSLTGPGRLDYP